MSESKIFKVPFLPTSIFIAFSFLFIVLMLPIFYNIYKIESSFLRMVEFLVTVLILYLFVRGITYYYNHHHKEVITIFDDQIKYQKYTNKHDIYWNQVNKIIVTDASATNNNILDSNFDPIVFCEKKMENFWYKNFIKKEATTITWAIYMIYDNNKVIKLLKSDFSKSNYLLMELIQKAKDNKILISIEAYVKYNPKFKVKAIN